MENTLKPFPVTQVGSWPRTRGLLRALRDRQKGRMSRRDFEALADEEVRRCVAHQVDADVDIVVDGEQRRDETGAVQRQAPRPAVGQQAVA